MSDIFRYFALLLILLKVSFIAVITFSNNSLIMDFLMKVQDALDPYIDFHDLLIKMPFLNDAFYQSMIATLVISILPFFILIFIPLKYCNPKSRFLKTMLGFAAGSLLGDSLFHLIYHSIEIEHHEEEHHDHNNFIEVSWFIFYGILTFFVLENIIRLVKNLIMRKKKSYDSSSTKESTVKSKPSEARNRKSKTVEQNVSKEKSYQKDENDLAIASLLNLVADFTHNFMDGLAIAIGFSVSVNIGFATTVGIFFHEIPHEISDFAILVKSGYSKWKAMFLQLLTAFGALFGTLLGSYLTENGLSGQPPHWVLPYTAGGFIYIACVSVIPELLHLDVKKDFVSNLFDFFVELLGMMLGMFIMKLLSVAHIH